MSFEDLYDGIAMLWTTRNPDDGYYFDFKLSDYFTDSMR